MVGGLDRFKEFFKGYENSYILIGGTACERHLSEAGIDFRTTDDLDIILIAEGLTPAFISRFWEFIEQGKYKRQEADTQERKFYRFSEPADKTFPYQLELFSRKPDVITLKEGMRLTPIPADGDMPSLSAILMDEDYYEFTLKNSQLREGLHLAAPTTLICLKAKAYLDLKARKDNGESVDKKNILKHRNDIVRLIANIPGNMKVETPESIKADLQEYITTMRAEDPDMKVVLKNAGLGIRYDEVLAFLEEVYDLK